MKVEILEMKGYHFLWIDDYLWMWNVPPEQAAQQQLANKAFGDVLVVGYGLGLIQQYVLNVPFVLSLLTIEKYPEVLEACREVFGTIHGPVITGNFYQLRTERKFDCIIGDIWEDIIPESLEAYREFKQQAEQFLKPEGVVLGWGQEFFEHLISKETQE